MNAITSSAARRLYSAGNNQGLGYAPYTDAPGPDTIDAAVIAAVADGWTVVQQRLSSDEVVVLSDADGAILGIGGDGQGNGAWAVPLLDSDGTPCARGVDSSGNLVGDEAAS